MRKRLALSAAVICVIFFCITLAGVPGLVIAENEKGYNLTIDGSIDTPARDIPGIGLQVSTLTTSELNGSVSVTAKAPADSEYRIQMYNSNRQTVASGELRSGDVTDLPIYLTGLQAGTYAVTLKGEGMYDFKSIQLVVIQGFNTSIIDTPTSATVGDEITVDVSVERAQNAGKTFSRDRVEVVLVSDSGNVTETATGSDGDYSATLNTNSLESGSYTVYATVRGTEDIFGEDEILGVSEESTITLESSDNAKTPPPSDANGTTRSGTPTVPSSDNTATPSDETNTGSKGDRLNNTAGTHGEDETLTATSVSTTITANPETNASEAIFRSNSIVDAIEFTSNSVSGSVTVSNVSETPQTSNPPIGASAATVDIQVPKEVETQPATVRMRVSTNRLAERDIAAEDLQMYRYANDAWNDLPTHVVESTETEVLIEADTPGFSTFAVSATSDPTATFDLPSKVNVGDEVTLDASPSKDKYGEIVSYDWVVGTESLNGETTATTLDDTGEITVELTVANDAGRIDTATQTVSVVNPQPSDDGADDTDSDNTGGATPVSAVGSVIVLVIVVAAGLKVYQSRKD